MPVIDQGLLNRTNTLVTMFEAAERRLAGPPVDLRVYFTLMHGYITKKIAKHIELFTSPNALMRLNDKFATAYLNALNGTPHGGWGAAFQRCKGLQDGVRSGTVGIILISPVAFEGCGRCMAEVHIKQDLRAALMIVRDVDVQDYGNVLIFVMEAALFAESRIRGGAGRAALAVTTGLIFAPKLMLDAKEWRNKVFEDCYAKRVPDPSPAFAAAYRKREGR